MPLGSFGSTAVLLDDVLGAGDLVVAESLTMVEVDEERLKVLARGARCVSLSSTIREKVDQHKGVLQRTHSL
jgi:hypothetical protein